MNYFDVIKRENIINIFIKGVIFFFILLLSACSLLPFKDEVAHKPTQLTEIKEPQVILKTKWKRNVGGTSGLWLKLKPLLHNNKIYAVNYSGQLSAFEQENGHKLYSISLGERIIGGLGINHDQGLLSTSSGHVIAFDLASGKKKWMYDAQANILSSPVAKNGIIVVQTINGHIIAIQEKNHNRENVAVKSSVAVGDTIWQKEVFLPSLMLRGSPTPIFFENTVLTGAANGDMYAWNLQTGEALWKETIALPSGSSELERMVDVTSTPLIVNNRLYSVSYQGNVKALNPTNGHVLWKNKMSSYQNMTANQHALYVSTTDGHIEAMNLLDGRRQWVQKGLAYRELSAPIVMNGYVIVGDRFGYLHVLSEKTGEIIGRSQISSSGIRVQPITDGQSLYIITNKGDLVAVFLQIQT